MVGPKGGSGTPPKADDGTKLERARCLAIVAEELLAAAADDRATTETMAYVSHVARRIVVRILSGGQS